MVELMLKNGANGALSNTAGETVLNWAASRGENIFEILEKSINIFKRFAHFVLIKFMVLTPAIQHTHLIC